MLEELDAPVKSFRVFALEWAIREGAGDDLMKVLLRRRDVEDDEECKVLLAYAIEGVKSRLEKAPIAATPSSSDAKAGAIPGKFSPESFLREFLAVPDPAKIRLIFGLDMEKIKELAGSAPDFLGKGDNPALASAVLQVFRKLWPAEKLQAVLDLLGSPFVSVRMAALELLIIRNPAALERHLPPLLASTDPRLRSLAIQGLSTLDTDTALEYLEEMLFSSDHWTRGCAVRNCLFLPFEKVKSTILRYLAFETNQALLEKAGAIIQCNPDTDVPFRLVETVERAGDARRPLLQKILDKTLRSIRDSGFLKGQMDEYLTRLAQWKDRRMAVAQLQSIVETSMDGEAAPRQAIEVAAAGLPSRPEIRKALNEAAGRELSQPGAPPAAPPPMLPTLEDGAGEIFDWLRDLVPESKGIWENRLKEIMGDKATPYPVRIACLRASRRLGYRGFSIISENLLRTEDEGLSAAAIEYLGWSDPDRLGIYLGKLLQSPSKRVVLSALGVLKGIDPARAVEIARRLLESNEPRLRDQGLSCLINFEFPLIRGILTVFLSRTLEEAHWKKGLGLFHANPDPDNLYPLFLLERKAPGKLAEKVQAIREMTRQNLAELGVPLPADGVATEGQLKERYDREENRKRSASRFARAPLEQTADASLASTLKTVFGLEGGVTKAQVVMAVVGVLIAVSGFFIMRAGEDSERRKVLADRGPLINEKISVIGQVEVARFGNSPVIELVASDGVRFSLEPPRRNFPALKIGDRIRVACIPLRKMGNGVIVGRATLIELLGGGEKRKK